MANIKVAVRVRPLSTRDSKNSGSSVVVYAEQNRISLTNLKVPLSKAGDSRERTRKYGFDYCFDSSDPQSENYAGQAKIYEILGKSLLDDLFAGYNSCLLAYGQSASGKTYTMMGTEEKPGLTPRLCQGIFARINEEKHKENIFHVSVSYLEIYNERVRDLLEPSSNSNRSLRVREHPRLGPYVQGLTRRVACTLERLMSYIEGGTRARKTGSTSQNASSSRSHTLLTLFLTPETTKTASKPIGGESVVEGGRTDRRYDDVASSTTLSTRNLDVAPSHYGSKLHLVDLAGSETARNCDGVHRLKEGANINKSLVALGNVISALAGRASTAAAPNKKYIPYRDSSLTWLLKDALGGNATTIMLATISPASRNYNETAHTLRFAQRAHCVVNKPVVNEDPMARTIRELRAEIARLKSLLLEKNIESDTKSLRYNEESEFTNYDPPKRNIESLENNMAENEGTVFERTTRDGGVTPQIRRVNSSESLTTIRDSDLVYSTVRKFGSYECLDRKVATSRTGYSYKRAKISELEDEGKELVDEFSNEAVFVDIPTLVAVLIKPDNNLEENSSAQIEEICSEEMQEYPIESDFVENGEGENDERRDVAANRRRRRRRGKLTSNEYEENEEESHFDSTRTSNDANDANDANDPSSSVMDSVGRKEKAKFRKQDSISVATSSGPSTNLYSLSRRFGSAETLEKKGDRLATLERSHTSLEKQATLPEEIVERYSGDSKTPSYGNLWKDANKSEESRNSFQGATSNESEKTPKDNLLITASKIRSSVARKPSLESLRRKTSKDSSSSSSKDEQILISSLTNERIIRRKDSLEHSPSARTHTPVQRAKRAEIVAAVTERLYSSRKQADETATAGVTGTTLASLGSSVLGTTSGVRSPPEGTDVRPIAATATATATSPFTAKSKLQEISRKMLAKRRRVNVETQTERMQTIRVKDSASLTDEKKIICQDVGILTDEHNDHREAKTDNGRLPVLRVKEIATLTDKLKDVTESKDAECLVNDLNFYEYGVNSLNESKDSYETGRCYTANKMSSTDSLELCLPIADKVDRFDKSTSTTAILPVERNPIVRTQSRQPIADEETTKYFGERCNVVESRKSSNSPFERPERNVISMSLPDSIGITIETTNLLESRVILIADDTTDETKPCLDKRDGLDLKNRESQTERQDVEWKAGGNNRCVLGALPIKPNVNQADNKCFRIENIFEDPRNVTRICREEASKTPFEERASKTSVTFTNSLGTCFVPETKECATGTDKDKDKDKDEGQVLEHMSMEELGDISGHSRVLSGRSSSRDKSISDTLRPTDVWKNWIISFPPTSWQRPRNLLSSVNVAPWTFAWNNSLTPLNDECTAVVSSTNLKTSREESSLNSSSSSAIFLPNDLYDKNQVFDLKSPSLIANLSSRRVIEQDYNFSDDSLDYNEDNVLSSNGSSSNNNKTGSSEEKGEGVENICPPDVVAHTKRESSVLVGNTCDSGIDSLSACLFENDRMELSKSKPQESRTQTSILVNDFKSVILGQRSANVDDDDPLREFRTDIQEKSDARPKRVTFLDNETLGERSQRATSPLNRNSFSKATVKRKTRESDTNPYDPWIDMEDRFEDRDKIEASLAQDETKFTNIFKISNDTNDKSLKEEDSDSYEDVDVDQEFIENCVSMKLKRKVLEEYLNEATAFMRNINSLNEYVVSSNVSVCGRRSRKEGTKKQRENHRRSCVPRNNENCGDNLMDESLKEVVPTESLEKCLEGLARLENCIRKTNEHDRYLREKYGILVESADAKSSLASSSIDSNTNSKISSKFIQRNTREVSDSSSKRTPFKDSSVTAENEENNDVGDSLGLDDDFNGEFERSNVYRLTSSPPSCHCCCTKNTRLENSYRKRARYDTRKLFHDDDTNSDNQLDDSVPTMSENVQLLANTLNKPTHCHERLERSLGENGSSRRTMVDAFMRCTKSETSNFINSRSFNRLVTNDTKSCSLKRWRYRSESPRAKFLELLRERRRIVESSRDVRS